MPEKETLDNMNVKKKKKTQFPTFQPAGTVEYVDCISAEGVKTSLCNNCLGYDIKQSDAKAPVLLDHWEVQSTTSLPSLPGPLMPGVVAHDRVLLMRQIEQLSI